MRTLSQLSKVETNEERAWYAAKALEEGWSRDLILDGQDTD